MPRRYSREMADRLAKADLVTVAGSGHLSALEKPDEVTAAMLSFLAGLT